MLSVAMLSVTMLSITLLRVAMLSVAMLSITMPIVNMLSVTMLSVTMLSVTMLSVTMLSIAMLSIIMLSVNMPSVTGPGKTIFQMFFFFKNVVATVSFFSSAANVTFVQSGNNLSNYFTRVTRRLCLVTRTVHAWTNAASHTRLCMYFAREPLLKGKYQYG